MSLMLGSIGSLMARESLGAIGAARGAARRAARGKRRHHPLVAALPLRTRFYASGLYISPLAPLLLGFGTGILTILLGIGGGFILVPAMIYLLGMATSVVVGTSLFQTLFVTAVATMVHATTTKAVDIVLAGLAADRIGDRRAGRRAVRDQGEARISAAGARGDGAAGRAAHPARAGLAARRDLLGRTGVRRLAGRARCRRAAADGATAPSPCWCPTSSQRNIEIAYSFTGAELLLFGAILYPGGRAADGARRRPTSSSW